MKTRFCIVLCFLITTGYGQEVVTESVTKFHSSNAALRIVAIQNVVMDLKNQLRPSLSPQPRVPSGDMVDLLSLGIADPDERIRLESLKGLSLLALRHATLGRDILSRLESARVPLVQLFEAQDPGVRAGAIFVYANLFGVSEEDEKRLITLFDREHSSLVRKEILTRILKGGAPSSIARAFVIRQIGNSTDAYDATMAIMGTIKPPPQEALAPIVNAFSDSPDSGKRDLLAQVLQQYGSAAKPFLGKITEMRDRETVPTVRNNFSLAVDRVSRP